MKATAEAFVYQPDDYDMRHIIEHTKLSLIMSGFGDEETNYGDIVVPPTVLPGPALPTRAAAMIDDLVQSTSAPKSSSNARHDSGSETAVDEFDLPAEDVAISPEDDDLITKQSTQPFKKRKLVTAATVPYLGAASDDANPAQANPTASTVSKRYKSNVSTAPSSQFYLLDRRIKTVPINVIQGVGSGVHLELNDRHKGDRMAPFAAATISAAGGHELLEQAAAIADDSINCQQAIIDNSFTFVSFFRERNLAKI
jgi:hypothetical protein